MLELARLRVHYAIILYTAILNQERLDQRLPLLSGRVLKQQKSMENLATLAASKIRNVILDLTY